MSEGNVTNEGFVEKRIIPRENKSECINSSLMFFHYFVLVNLGDTNPRKLRDRRLKYFVHILNVNDYSSKTFGDCTNYIVNVKKCPVSLL